MQLTRASCHMVLSTLTFPTYLDQLLACFNNMMKHYLAICVTPCYTHKIYATKLAHISLHPRLYFQAGHMHSH